MLYEDFFERIKQYAKARNTTIEAIVNFVTNGNVNRDIYYGWKKGRTLPSGEYCYQIAHYMGVSTDWLISGSESTIFDKYTDILQNLDVLDDTSLKNVRAMVAGLAASKIQEKKEHKKEA